MPDSFGSVLRSVRDAAGISLAGLAARTNYSKAEIGHVETGARKPSAGLAMACDQALGTAPLLATVVETDAGQDDQMKRRALLSTIAATVGVSGLGGASALADVVRHGLLASADATEDWDATVEDFSRRIVTAPNAQYGQALLAQLMIARQQNIDLGLDPDRLRALAQLGHLYGLWLGNRGDVHSARGWYRSASLVADRSGDSATRVFVRARTVSRGIYEGYTARETVDGAEEALSISRKPSPGALEAHSALVCVHALTGALELGRSAVKAMEDVADRIGDTDSAKPGGAHARTVSFRNYLEGRIGPRRAADRAFAAADQILRTAPVWHADAKIYYGHALVRDGDIADGVSLTLSAAKGLGHEVRVLSVGVRDVLSAVPAGYRSEELDELRAFAATGPCPWETIA